MPTFKCLKFLNLVQFFPTEGEKKVLFSENRVVYLVSRATESILTQREMKTVLQSGSWVPAKSLKT